MTFFRRLFDPRPEDQKQQGFQPNLYIRWLRFVSRLLISVLRLNGHGRFSNEFIQALDPRFDVALPDGGTIVVRTGHGRLLWRALTFLTEEPITIRWIDSFSKNDVFFDVGANIGSYSLYAARRGVQAVAFEAELFNAQLLYENFHLNGTLESCIVVPLAVGEKTARDVFYLKTVSKGDALHSVGKPSYLLEDPTSTQKMAILVVSLDDAIRMFDLPPPTKLKVDVDSNELQILKGAAQTLRGVDEVLIELDLKLADHRQAMTLLEDMGFVVAEEENISRSWNPEITNRLFRRRAASEAVD